MESGKKDFEKIIVVKTKVIGVSTNIFVSTFHFSHPKYRAALYKRFPALACSPSTDDSASAASGATNVSADEKSTVA
jgi:hypothetical protein